MKRRFYDGVLMKPKSKAPQPLAMADKGWGVILCEVTLSEGSFLCIVEHQKGQVYYLRVNTKDDADVLF